MLRISFRPKNSTPWVAQGCGFLFGAVWILFWSGITLAFLGMLLYNGWRQIVALGYPTAPAVITHSEVTHGGKSGKSGKLELKYRIDFDGREVIGTKRRYNETSSNDGWAEQAIKNYPVGKQVTAYYPPHDPSDAILSPGIEGVDLFLAMFLTPFTIVMLAGWAVAWDWLRGSRAHIPAAGLKVVDRGGEIAVTLPGYPPLAVAAGALLAASFVMVFVVGFGFGFHASLSVMLVVWAILLGLTAVVYFKCAIPLWNGSSDLVIDLIHQRVQVPQSFGRIATETIAIADISGVAVDHHVLHNSKNKDSRPNAVTLYHRVGSGSTPGERLAEFGTPERASAFADWLREQLKIAHDGKY